MKRQLKQAACRYRSPTFGGMTAAQRGNVPSRCGIGRLVLRGSTQTLRVTTRLCYILRHDHRSFGGLRSLFRRPLLGALAVAGRFSVTASQVLLGLAFVVACVGLRTLPVPQAIGCALVILGSLILLSYWAKPKIVPGYSGILTSIPSRRVETLFSPAQKIQAMKLEIGQSGSIFVDSGLNGKP